MRELYPPFARLHGVARYRSYDESTSRTYVFFRHFVASDRFGPGIVSRHRPRNVTVESLQELREVSRAAVMILSGIIRVADTNLGRG